jgi:fructosamine-3-kinase
MNSYDQEQTINSTDDVVKKMESYFLATQDEMRQLRAEIAELTRLLKAQRVSATVSSNLKSFGAPSISDMLNTKSADS